MATPMTALDHLPVDLLRVYEACIASKEVLYYPSTVTVEDNAIRTQIRLCESLSRKPGPTPEQRGQATPDSEKLKRKDVFAVENWDTLLVDGNIESGFDEAYGVLLNKFAVVPYHFVLVTKHWESQKLPLSPPQLLTSYRILQSFANARREAKSAASELLCFFNCGDSSGASQPHKHVQFAPMEGDGSLGHFPTEKAAAACTLEPHELDNPFLLGDLAHAHHVRRLQGSILTPDALAKDPATAMQHLQIVYLSLLDGMIDNLRALPGLEQLKLGKGLSYNLLLTRQHMHIIPRSQGGYRLPEDDTFIGCNSLAYTGTLLVKSEADARHLRAHGGVLEALRVCGFPKADVNANLDPNHDVDGQ